MGLRGKGLAALVLAAALAGCFHSDDGDDPVATTPGGGGMVVMPPTGGGGGGMMPTPDCTSAAIQNNAFEDCALPGQRAGLADAATSLAVWKMDHGFSTQPALETIKAHYAYGNGSAGFDGTGVTVAVIADGIDNYAALRDAAGMARPTRVASTGYGGSTRTAGAHAQDCHETTTTCGGTSTATVIAGLTLGSSVTEANSLRGVAPGAKLLDIPFEDLWDVVCTNNLALSSIARGDCTRRIFGGTIKMHADVLGALIGEAVARTDKPRYLLMYSTDPLAAGSSDSHQYLPLYTDTARPSSQAVTFLEGVLSGLGAAIWQGGPPASGEDLRSIVVVAAGDDRDSNPLLTRSCRIPGIGDSPVSCGDNSAGRSQALRPDARDRRSGGGRQRSQRRAAGADPAGGGGSGRHCRHRWQIPPAGAGQIRQQPLRKGPPPGASPRPARASRPTATGAAW